MYNNQESPFAEMSIPTHDFSTLPIREVVSNLTGQPFQVRGLKVCPLCGHKDCFKFVPNIQYFICFSSNCNKRGHVLQFVAFYKNITIREAAKYLIQTYFTNTHAQEVF